VTRTSTRSKRVDSLVLRRTDYGEADFILLVFTNDLGIISVHARGARKSTKRFSGGIEPFHGLTLTLDAPNHGELYRLREAELRRLRLTLVQNLTAMNVAGRALSWVRRSLPPLTPEPAVFFAIENLLDQLDIQPPNSTSAGEALLAEFGLNLLSHLGWALELTRCIRCGRLCPQGVPALLDPRRGGLVCRSCGGGPYRISAMLRNIMLYASRGTLAELSGLDASMVLDIVEDTLAHHPGVNDG
jgi:DNA repair protein RecO (recombination protein O)